MSRLIVLDAGPLGLLSKAPGRPDTARCRDWLNTILRGGVEVAVPEIARYEVRRKLHHLNLAGGLGRLDRLHPQLVRLQIAGDVMDLASELWAEVRRSGLPTASDESLDGDAILAAQALVAARDWEDVVLATGNVRHLNRFSGLDSQQRDLIRQFRPSPAETQFPLPDRADSRYLPANWDEGGGDGSAAGLAGDDREG